MPAISADIPAITVDIRNYTANNNFDETAYNCFADSSFPLSGVHTSDLNKQFIKFYKLFKSQFDELTDFYAGVDFRVTSDKVALSLNNLIELDPEVMSLELTHEHSVFYSIKKHNFSFFIQHFLNEIDSDDDDEAILIVYKGNQKLPSYAGSLANTLYELNILLDNQ